MAASTVNAPQAINNAGTFKHESKPGISAETVVTPSPPPSFLTVQHEDQIPTPASEMPSIGRWATFTSKSSIFLNRKVDITIGRLSFIIGVVALIVAVLSYSYGAASFRVAERAYQLQQLEFCKDHGDDPVGPDQAFAFEFHVAAI
ncbi:MAG: hypothetical protein Q9201_005236 [Fulgogasparrea decipioides]